MFAVSIKIEKTSCPVPSRSEGSGVILRFTTIDSTCGARGREEGQGFPQEFPTRLGAVCRQTWGGGVLEDRQTAFQEEGTCKGMERCFFVT